MGDDTSFLFNLTLNLRFNALPGKSFYQKADEDKIVFGNGDLVITEDFDRVTSVIKPADKTNQVSGKKKLDKARRSNVLDPVGDIDLNPPEGSHFCFGNNLNP